MKYFGIEYARAGDEMDLQRCFSCVLTDLMTLIQDIEISVYTNF